MADRTFPTVSRRVGSYDFCHPSEKQANYVFLLPGDAPQARVSCMTPVDHEQDIGTEDVWLTADAMLAYAKSLLFDGGLPKFQAMWDYMNENEEKHRVAMWCNRVQKARVALKHAEEMLKNAGLDLHEAEGDDKRHCHKCSQALSVHNDDGSCVKD